jgi:murein DD-endopeptidase MepM/ murein hydrolase activator NlpD
MALNPPMAVGSYTLTQGFGFTGLGSNGAYFDNRTGTYYQSGFHTGLDLAAPVGTKIYAPEHGTVWTASWEGQDPRPGYGKWAYGGGNVIILKHNNHPTYTSFAHLNRMYVKTGQPVYKGQLIGEVGQTGFASGPHVHFSVWFRGLWYTVNKAYVEDPRKFYPGGAYAEQDRIDPTRAWIGPGVNIRTAATTTSAIRSGSPTTGTRTYFPYFRDVTGQTLTMNGITSNRWAQIWAGNGWSYVWRPLVGGFTI